MKGWGKKSGREWRKSLKKQGRKEMEIVRGEKEGQEMEARRRGRDGYESGGKEKRDKDRRAGWKKRWW